MNLEKVLTYVSLYGIIIKLSRETASRSEELEKYFKKVLDKQDFARYNKQAVP